MSNKELLPSDLLFKSVSLYNSPLFKSYAELARNIVKKGGPKFSDRSEYSVRSYLSQIFKPINSPRSRPLSKDFRKAILNVVAIKLKDKKEFKKFVESFDTSFALLKMDNNVSFNKSNEFVELEEAAEKFTHHVIFTSRPAEIVENSEYADQLRDLLIEKLKLTSSLEKISKSCRYEFFVNSTLIAKKLWCKIYEYLLFQKKVNNAFKILESINSKTENMKQLSINVVKPQYCICNTIVFNPDANERVGFNLYYHHGNESKLDDQVSVAKLSNDAISDWYKYQYISNTMDRESTGAKEIKWIDVANEFYKS